MDIYVGGHRDIPIWYRLSELRTRLGDPSITTFVTRYELFGTPRVLAAIRAHQHYPSP
jgi:hypothetical protein